MVTVDIQFDMVPELPFVNNLRRNLLIELNRFGRVLSGNGRLGLKRVMAKSSFRGAGFDPNSPPWKIGKDNKGILYNTGFLASQPSYIVRPGAGDDFGSVEVGFINDTGHPSSGVSVQKLVSILVSGTAYTPSVPQRRAFWAKVSEKGAVPTEYHPVWVTPARDFITEHFNSTKVHLEFIARLDRAVQKTLNRKVVVKS